MPFHQNKAGTFCFHKKTILNGYPPLQVSKPKCLMNHCSNFFAHNFLKKLNGERVYKITSEKQDGCRGSVTLETALILPFLICIFWAMFQVYQLYMAQIKLENGMMVTGRELGRTYYIAERSEELGHTWINLLDSSEQQDIQKLVGNGITDIYLKQRILEETGENIWNIKAAEDSLTTLGSALEQEAGYLDIQVNYNWNIQVLPGIRQKFYQKQWQRHALWTGTSLCSHQTIVYITPTGTVYHMNKQCTHLKMQRKRVASADLEKLRNNQGRPYECCSLCKNGLYSGTYVYVTQEGNKYHMDEDCSALKRSVIAISKDKVSGMSMCKRCGLD